MIGSDVTHNKNTLYNSDFSIEHNMNWPAQNYLYHVVLFNKSAIFQGRVGPAQDINSVLSLTCTGFDTSNTVPNFNLGAYLCTVRLMFWGNNYDKRIKLLRYLFVQRTTVN